MYTQEDKQLAKKILSFSCELEEGQNVMLQLIGLNGIGLMRALVETAREMKVHPFLQINDTDIQRMLVEKGDRDFWKQQTDVDQLPLMKQMDAFVGVRASQNIYEQSEASKEANDAYSEEFLKPVHFQERVNNTNWVVLRYPSPAFAMNAKMPTERFKKFYYKAFLLDYSQLAEAMKPLEERLRKTDMIQLKGEGTDIQFSVKGQNWIPCFGKRNIPDGELFSSPILSSVDGHITYASSVYQGKPFDYVKLEVRDGVAGDHPHLLQPDDGEEEPDTGPHRELHRFGEEPDDVLPGADRGEEDEDNPLDYDRGERRLPGDAEAEDDREREEGVQAEPRRQAERPVGVERHHEDGDGGGEDGHHREVLRHLRCRPAGDVRDRDPEDGRVDDDDVAHRQERRQPGEHLGPEVRAVRLESEVVAQRVTQCHEVRLGARGRAT